MITIGVELIPIRTPNYILVRNSKVEQKFHVKEIDAGTLSALCDQFRQDLFEKAGKKDPNK